MLMPVPVIQKLGGMSEDFSCMRRIQIYVARL